MATASNAHCGSKLRQGRVERIEKERARLGAKRKEKREHLQVMKAGNAVAGSSKRDGLGHHVDEVVVWRSAHDQRHVCTDATARGECGLQAKRCQRQLVHGVAAAAVVGSHLQNCHFYI